MNVLVILVDIVGQWEFSDFLVKKNYKGHLKAYKSLTLSKLLPLTRSCKINKVQESKLTTSKKIPETIVENFCWPKGQYCIEKQIFDN